MSITGDLWGSLANPAPTFRSLNKIATLTQGAFLVIIAAAIAGAIAGGIAIWGRYGNTGTIFFNAFINIFATAILTFIGVVILAHIFLHALEKAGSITKFAAILAFPYSGITILNSILLLLMTGIQKSGTGDIVTYAILFVSFVIVAVSIYAYILYSMVIKESYKTGIAMAAVVILLAGITVSMFSLMMSLFNIGRSALF